MNLEKSNTNFFDITDAAFNNVRLLVKLYIFNIKWKIYPILIKT